VADEIQVHPAAAVFPMLSDDELADLAEDIKANGLLHPITLDAHGVLVDGRNRLAACNLAGVEPTFVTYKGDDPVGFILSENIHRRHISKGQQAMAVVMATELSGSGQFRKQGQRAAAADLLGVRGQRLSEAAVVRKYAPDLAKLVVTGDRFLDDAYREARGRKLAQETQAESDARALRETNAKTARLREQAPDLADLVAEWRMSLDEAVALLDKRAQEKRDAQRRHVTYMIESTTMLRTLLYRDPAELLDEWVSDVSAQQREGPFAEHIWSPDGLRCLARDLDSLADEMAARREAV
jgi:hypothetical protein